MKLVQSRIVTDDVEGLAGFYARLLGVPVALNEYYVEIEAGSASVGFSKRRFTEYRENDAAPTISATDRRARTRSSSISWSTTSTPSTRESPRSASNGCCRPPLSPGETDR